MLVLLALLQTFETYESKHYAVRTTGSKEQAQQLAEYMEKVYETYSDLLNYDEPIKKKFTIVLYKEHAEYSATTGGSQALAHYSPQKKELVGSWDEDGMWAIFAHEGMHQFTDMVTPVFGRGATPMWYTEGMADCIGNSVVKKEKLYMCSMDGYIGQMRTWVIQTAIREKRTPALKELTTWDTRRFYGDGARLNYATAWSFCHFLMTYPKVEEPDKRIPKGKYKKHLGNYHILLTQGKSGTDAWKEAFGEMDWEKLQEVWAEYVMKFPDPAAGTPFEGLRVDLDNLHQTDAVYLGTLDPETPIGKSGLQSKDAILDVDGYKTNHFGRLCAAIGKIEKGATAKVRVKRGGSEQVLDVTF